jgi:formylglycine-generating enzyme required for sulfatase activity
MNYKSRIIGLVAVVVVVAVSVTLIAVVRSEKTPAVPDEGPLASLQAKEFVLPDAIEMVRIPAGKFVMGSPEGEVGRGEDESQRAITISKPFYMAKHEIKQNQYVPMMSPNYNPIFFAKGSWGWSLPEVHQHGPYTLDKPEVHTRSLKKKPMDGVSWKYAVAFCKKLTAREKAAGRLPKGYEYRLPTEAEWEYACRAGTTGAFNDEQVEKTVDQIGKMEAEIIAGKASKSDRILNKGGVANKFGLMDMHMGMLEWVLDDYAPYAGDSQADPVVLTDGKSKVVRGGFDAFYEDPSPKGRVHTEPKEWRRYVRSASRGHLTPGMPYPYVGLRPVLAPATTVPQPTIPEKYNIGVLRAEDTAVRESDLAEFKKAMGKK